ncbi:MULTISPECIES: lipid A deacylase LpxR family protein [Gammaproteobacteria]|uniref:Lipid A deacylase LpxR family protein n=1 Tax=Marilutibacter chinensis TaxID=2912247 RepID=A0ABS9HQD6_9GAMM|nr:MULTISPECIES: lipid A deacylase LpxR family protein [Gammaproteobacteria]MCF7220444.1 lipid A deacylase LpxR family protein [Lysobacter chinensis]PAU61303.1 hypothetical protein BZL42_08940 [Pseudomonas indica]
MAIGAVLWSGSVLADEGCDRKGVAAESTVNLRVDNDLFGGLGQDQGYSNGFLLTLVSPNLVHRADDPCLPDIARRLNRTFSTLQPGGFDELNMTIGLGQMMYTPTDRVPRELIADDRPYAGALMFSVGYNARRGDHLRTSQLRLGIVGPAAKAREVQDWWHGVIDVDRFNGWDNQLHNEPVVQFIHERRKRFAPMQSSGPWRWDAIAHWGGSLGNFATYANSGMELRFGYLLPDDFGTAPLRPAGENTSPIRTSATQGWRGHLFVAADARWVLRDITLDGNTFRSSHSVNKRPFVADIGYGIAITHGHWRFAFARYNRTREFEGQRERPSFGSFTIGRRF